MKRKMGLSVLLAGVAVLILAGTGVAGVEPSPFKPEINKLNAIENGLHSVGERVNLVLASPPGQNVQSPAVQGVVGRLSAMGNQLSLLDGMINSVMDEVLQTSPDGSVPKDLIPALDGVKTASQTVADSVGVFLGSNPSIPIVFSDALASVKGLSQTVADDAVRYLSGGACISGAGCGCIGTSTSCQGMMAQSSCLSQVGCTWSGTAPCVGPSGCDALTTPGSCRLAAGCTWSDTVPGTCVGTATPCSALDSGTCARQGGCRAGTCVNGTCQ